jgi:hypothetical protein
MMEVTTQRPLIEHGIIVLEIILVGIIFLPALTQFQVLEGDEILQRRHRTVRIIRST